jgi:hypothetical protein
MLDREARVHAARRPWNCADRHAQSSILMAGCAGRTQPPSRQCPPALWLTSRPGSRSVWQVAWLPAWDTAARSLTMLLASQG